MKRYISILTIILYSQIIYGQDKVLSSDSDTAYWYKSHNTLLAQTGLPLNENIKAEFFFRFWDGFRAIDIIKNNEKITGNLTFILRQRKNNEDGRLYYKTMQLTDSNSNKILNLILKYGLINLPSDKMIKGWDGGLDGIVYFTEYSDDKIYSFKNYWTPEVYKNLPAANQILDFISELDKLQELKEKNNDFMRQQPFKSWYSFIGSAEIVIKR